MTTQSETTRRESLVFLWDYSFILPRIRQHTGYHRLLVTASHRRFDRQAVAEAYDDVLLVDDFDDLDAVAETISQVVGDRPVRSVFGTFEHVVEAAGGLRERLGVPGADARQARLVRDKAAMKQRIRDSGLPVADWIRVTSVPDVIDFADRVGWPVVVKPLRGAATEDTLRLDDAASVKLALTHQLAGRLAAGDLLAESFVRGVEYECDALVRDGQVVFRSVGRYLTNCLEAVETGAPVALLVYPQQALLEPHLDRIVDLNRRAIRALEIQDGITHAEYFVDQDGNVTFGELATRIGGGPLIGACVRRASGVDIYSDYVDAGIGLPVARRIDPSGPFTGVLAFPLQQGQVVEITPESALLQVPGIVEARVLVRAGDLLDSAGNTAVRAGYIVAEGLNETTVLDALRAAFQRFRLTTVPPEPSPSRDVIRAGTTGDA